MLHAWAFLRVHFWREESRDSFKWKAGELVPVYALALFEQAKNEGYIMRSILYAFYFIGSIRHSVLFDVVCMRG